MKYINYIILLAIIWLASYQVQAQNSNKVYSLEGTDVINMMHDKYFGDWYENITFKQETLFYNDENTSPIKQLWHEALLVGKGLIIKFDHQKSGNGLIFKNNKQFTYNEGELVQEREVIHDLLVLGFDIYSQKPSDTIKMLESNGYDLSEAHETTYKSRDVYVVGRSSLQEDGNYFIIDKERLVFLMLERELSNGDKSVIEFENYKKLEGGWIAPTVKFYRNEKLTMAEQYCDILVNQELSDNILETDSFSEAAW